MPFLRGILHHLYFVLELLQYLIYLLEMVLKILQYLIYLLKMLEQIVAMNLEMMMIVLTRLLQTEGVIRCGDGAALPLVLCWGVVASLSATCCSLRSTCRRNWCVVVMFHSVCYFGRQSQRHVHHTLKKKPKPLNP